MRSVLRPLPCRLRRQLACLRRGEFPAADLADVPGFDRFHLAEVAALSLGEFLVERVAHHHLARACGGVKARGKVDAIADGSGASPPEWPHGNDLQIAEREAEVTTAGLLDV